MIDARVIRFEVSPFAICAEAATARHIGDTQRPLNHALATGNVPPCPNQFSSKQEGAAVLFVGGGVGLHSLTSGGSGSVIQWVGSIINSGPS